MLFSSSCLPNIFIPLVFGYLVDRVGGKYLLLHLFFRLILIFSELLILAGQISFYTGTSRKHFPSLLAGRFVFGIGCEIMGIATSSISALWFRDKEVSLSMSLDVTITHLISFVICVIEPAIYSKTASLLTTYFVGVITCVLSLAISFVVYAFEKERERQCSLYSKKCENGTSTTSTTDIPHEPGSFVDIIKLPKTYWFLCATMVIGAFPSGMFGNVSIEFYQYKYGFSVQTSNTVVGLESLILAATIPVIGYWVCKYSHNAMIGISSATLILSNYIEHNIHNSVRLPIFHWIDAS